MDRGNLNNSGGRLGDGHDSRKDYSHSSSLKFRASTNDDDSVERGVPVVDSVYNNVNAFSNPKDEDFEYDGGESSFVSFGREGIDEEASRRSSHGSDPGFDKSDSDAENYGFDRSPTYDEDKPQQRFKLPLSSHKTHEHLSTNTASWSPKSTSSKIEKPSSSVFLTRKSSSSDYLERSMHGLKLDNSTAATFDESDGKTSRSEETDCVRNQGKKFDADPPAKFSKQPNLVFEKNRNEIGNSSPEREEGLNFEKLTGGFRHKGYNYPSFGKKQFYISSSKNESPRTEPKNRMPDRQSTPDTDSSGEEDWMQKSLDHKHRHSTLNGGKDLKTTPSFAASNSAFGSDDSDLDEDELLRRRTSHLHSGISRRTKAFPAIQEKEKNSKLQLRSKADNGMDGKATSSETFKRYYEIKRNSMAAKPANSDARGLLYQRGSEMSDSGIVQESKLSAEQDSLPMRKTNPNPRMLNKTSSNTDFSNQKVSHVHPKLPDYDNFVQFFQKNRS
ncbi:hypothetical protein SASPL_117599 [Salvia splendens]|uniref:Uncharacterized protein n=1 Tax=Salvia splendens TaxID=180675 RepID=A0A8X8XV60_SALSN|nr:hypothetical protein SASPL_117599 [Salvia splendens]